MNKVTKVYIRLMFLRIGGIDTLNDRYQAQAAIQARWPVDIDKLSANLSPDDQKRLINGKSISLVNYAISNWHPQLYIENALGELKEQIRYSAKRSKVDNEVYVCEHRDVKGLFWEKLELHHFPSDVQDLSISISTMLYDDKVILVTDPYHPNGVIQEAFLDQQKWKLYEYVDTEQKDITEFLFQNGNKDDDGYTLEDSTKYTGERQRSVLTVTCHAARRSNYFYWNGYCLVLFISLVSFCTFAIPPNNPEKRILTSSTLLLTSVSFRWTVNQTLPAISYLTSLDKYSLICLFSLVIQSFWHAIIGSIIFLGTKDNRVTPSMWYIHLDQIVFFTLFGSFILMHIGLTSWLFLVPLKHRKNLAKKDVLYEQSMLNSKEGLNRKNGRNNLKKSSFSRMPIGSTK